MAAPIEVEVTTQTGAGVPSHGGRFGLLRPLSLATLLLLAVAALSLVQGAASIPPGTAIAFVLNRLPFVDIAVDAPATWETIVIDVRLPRLLAAGLAGAALAYSGATYQGVFRNPLADPYLLGVASGAALGASIAIVSPLESGTYGFGWVPLLAFLGAAVAVLLAYLFAQAGRSRLEHVADPRGHRYLGHRERDHLVPPDHGRRACAADLRVPLRVLQYGDMGTAVDRPAIPRGGRRGDRPARAAAERAATRRGAGGATRRGRREDEVRPARCGVADRGDGGSDGRGDRLRRPRRAARHADDLRWATTGGCCRWRRCSARPS